MSTYVDIRATYVAQTYLPLVHNFYPYAEQQSHIGREAKLYRSIYVAYIGSSSDLYRSLSPSSRIQSSEAIYLWMSITNGAPLLSHFPALLFGRATSFAPRIIGGGKYPFELTAEWSHVAASFVDISLYLQYIDAPN